MTRLHDTLNQDAVWEQLMAKLREIEERMHYAVTLHKLMNQHSHIDIPVQYERLFIRSPSRGKRKKSMIIEQALTAATEGGYHIRGSDGVDTSYEGASNEYSAWTRKDNHSTFMVAVEETFLDPEFWQALGRALGWDHKLMTIHAIENGRPTIVTRARQHWLSHWHRFIDHLAEGKDAESFFASLALPFEENVSANIS